MHPRLIKNMRLLTGFTQNEIGEKIGVHGSLISKIEKGTIQPTKETEVKLMNVFSEAGINIQIIYQINNLIKNKDK